VHYQALLKQAELGEISEDEVRKVAEELASSAPGTDRFTLLQILGEAQAKSFRALIERYLESPDDPMLARLALEILCLYWGEPRRYLAELRRFVGGVAWDKQSDVRQVAILLSGNYLRSNSDPVLLRAILDILEDPAESTVIRGDAYLALGRAMGRDWNSLPSATTAFDPATQLDGRLLEEAKARLEDEEKGGLTRQ
jgi:hypothetical protein